MSVFSTRTKNSTFQGQGQGEHLLSLIEGTLDIARIESGRMALDVRPMAFADHLREVARLFELQAAAKGLHFEFRCATRLPANVRADEKRLRQILINLLGNAVKFTRVGSVCLQVSYTREMALFEVRDSGPGMAPEELERVFEPFERAGSAESAGAVPGSPGTGLGLTIARMLTDLMGGEMSVRSNPGEGTVFKVRLFLPEWHGAVQATEAGVRTPTGYRGRRRRLLVVDNEEADRELLAHWLQPLGFEVRLATSGDDALNLLEGLRPGDAAAPDAIFMDLAMPGIDGWETIRRLRQMGWGEVPVAIVSANAFDRGLQAELDGQAEAPPQDFLVKPVRRSDLLAWLGQKLELDWLMRAEAPPEGPVAVEARPAAPIRCDELAPLLERVRLGYPRGIVEWLEEWVEKRPDQAELAQSIKVLAREFRFDAIEQQLQALCVAGTDHEKP